MCLLAPFLVLALPMQLGLSKKAIFFAKVLMMLKLFFLLKAKRPMILLKLSGPLLKLGLLT